MLPTTEYLEPKICVLNKFQFTMRATACIGKIEYAIHENILRDVYSKYYT